MEQRTDILLVVPHQPHTASILKTASGITLPLGIAYIASYLEKNGFSVRILDNSIERLDAAGFRERVKSIRPACVGFSVCTSSYNSALNLAGLAKEADSSIIVVMGGVQASALPEEVLKNSSVDIAVIGEGEETTRELLQVIRDKRDLELVNGIVFKRNGSFVRTPERGLIENIDSLPLPAYHLLPMDKYSLPASRRLTAGRCASIVTSRGCPYGCYFCSHNSVFKGKLRFRSPKSIVAEMKRLVNEYQVKELLIWDDSFLLDKKRALEICRLILENELDVIWSCSSRVDHMTEELASWLYRAGCRLVLFGAESGSQAILDSVNKRTTLAQIENAVSVCRKNKLMSFCSFILGTPGETEETARQTLEFARKLRPDFAIFCIFAPLPGSAFFDKLTAEGRLKLGEIDWDRYINLLSNSPPLISTSALSAERLVQLQKEGFRSFYFRGGYIIQRLRKIRSPGQLYEACRGFWALMQLTMNRFSFEEGM